MNPYAGPQQPGMPPQQGMMPPPGPPMQPGMMPPRGVPMMGPMLPAQQPCQHCPIPCGAANAFTQAGNPRPIPADMGRDPSNTDNAFQSIANATLAVPPGCCPCDPHCAPNCMAGGYGYGPMVPPGPPMAMGPGGYYLPPPPPMQYGGPGPMFAVPPGQPVMPNVAMAPVRGAEQQALAQAAPPAPPAHPGYPGPVVPVGAKVAAGTNPAPLPEEASVPELLSLLSDSLYPSQREWAADRLTRFDWRYTPQIVEGLLLAARDDPAPLVRVACVRSLVTMKAGTTYVVLALQEMKHDKDERVRREAEQALNTFVPGGARATDRPSDRPAK
jgi:hypothetical protein